MDFSVRSQRRLVLLIAAVSIACASVPRSGDVVHITEESALIIWDATSKTQHFIRRAQFDTGARDFGFLVPTPTRPAFSEVDDAIFGYLVNVTRPPVRRVQQLPAGRSPAPKPAGSSLPPRTVTVVESRTVAGLNAVVLEANDARALERWLHEHGYASGPELVEWFKPYIAKNWIITAFRIAKSEPRAANVATYALRMSFKTDLPFFPYREPTTRGSAPRALEVYFVSGERVEGRIGPHGRADSTLDRVKQMVGLSVTGKWPGNTLWAQPLGEETRDGLLIRTRLPRGAVPANAWLTRFLDASSPRPGTDELYFSRADDQSRYMDEARLEAELQIKEAAKGTVIHWKPMPDSPADDVAAILRQAEESQRDGRISEAIRILRRAARGGSSEAALRLGEIYEEGRPGIPRDHLESLQWYQVARTLGMKVGAPPGR